MTADTLPDIVLLVPCLDEAGRIGTCLDALARWARERVDRVALVVLDDGSKDGTAEVARAWRGEAEVRVETVAGTRPGHPAGKGAALRHGVARFPGRVVAFLDADLAVGPDQLDALLAALERSGVEIAIGSRALPSARVDAAQPWPRRAMGRAYLGLARRLLGLRVTDVTCGFKALDGALARSLFARTRSRRWGLDAELLYLAVRGGTSVAEVPVTWRDGGSSRVRLLRDVPGSFGSLVATRWRHRRPWLAPSPLPRQAQSEVR